MVFALHSDMLVGDLAQKLGGSLDVIDDFPLLLGQALLEPLNDFLLFCFLLHEHHLL